MSGDTNDVDAPGDECQRDAGDPCQADPEDDVGERRSEGEHLVEAAGVQEERDHDEGHEDCAVLTDSLLERNGLGFHD